MIELNGSYGEGGGAVLRQAIAFSLHTQKSFHMENVRIDRENPGVKMQHLKALNAAQQISNAKVEGNREGSTEVTFEPETLKGSSLKIDIETAGSITLLLQALMMPAVLSLQKFKFEIEGGTDVKWSPPIDYYQNVFLPHLKKFGDVSLDLQKRGYYPKGDGKVKVVVEGNGDPEMPIRLAEQKELFQIKGVSHASRDLAGREVSERQAKSAELILSDIDVPVDIRREYSRTSSTGSGVVLWSVYGDDDGVDFDNPVILGGDSLGEPKKKASEVGEQAAKELMSEMKSGAGVDKYTADQIIPYLAFSGGSVKTSEITDHTRSNIYVAEKFTNASFEIDGQVVKCSLG